MRKFLKRCLGLAVAMCVCLCALAMPANAVPEIREAMLPWLKKNPDTVGWLKIGTTIDTPVVQHESDGEYYLAHDFNGHATSAGTVQLDWENRIWPQDEQMVVYGHNMRDGTVFGKLDLYRRIAFLKANPIISFDTLYEEGLYVVIAVFDVSADEENPEYMNAAIGNFDDEQHYADFVAEARQRSYYEIPIDSQPGDRQLVLYTCSYGRVEDGRLVVLCRELRPDEDQQQMAERMQAAEWKE